MQKAFCWIALGLASWAPAALAQNHSNAGTEGWTAPAVLTIQAPEPSSVALLAIDLTSVGALVYLVRRRRSRNR